MALVGALLVTSACPDLPEVFTLAADAVVHVDAGLVDATGRDAGAGPDAPIEAGVDAGCGPQTPNFGEACGECGLYVCDLEGQLICYDPGQNMCGVCGELDDSVGTPGAGCGTCGVVSCATDGLATECTDEHPTNECGGCAVINAEDGGTTGLPYRGPPGTTCSSCGTGEWRCTADQDDLACFRGRGTTSCGGCARCVLSHAEMDQRFNGVYLKTGTLALIEDTGTDSDVGSDEVSGNNISLTFDPLVAGPGVDALAMAYVFLWPRDLDQFDPDDFDAFWLTPEFAASVDPDPLNPYLGPTPADELRRYMIWSFYPIESYRFVVVYDFFFEQIISAGELFPGPPAELLDNDAGFVDAGVEDASRGDAGRADVPGSDTRVTEDARVAEDASAVRDAGAVEDAIVVEDAARADAGDEDLR